VALNKARTSIWVKTLIIILIVAFISLFMYSGIAGLFDLFKPTPGQTTATLTPAQAVAAINQKHQPTIDALKALAASQPASYTATVNLANGYFDWGQELSQPQTGQSQVSTESIAAAEQVWPQARAAYDAATKLKAFDAGVQTDRAAATFYSSDATGAIAIARNVTKKQPTFAPAWLNLGIFYDATGNSVSAVSSYQKYLVLDPKGNNVAYAQQRLKALASGSTSGTTSP